MTFAAARYCQRRFPPYRFVPGKFPHPTAHPDGHSYHPPEQSPPPVPYRSAAQWSQSDDYLYGCDLYNHGYWWEAHEAWEGLWQLTDKGGPQGRFLQGLIQVTACHLQLHMGHLIGVRRLRNSSAEYLSTVLRAEPGERYMGLCLREWLEKLQRYYDETMTRHPHAPCHDPGSYPYLLLEGSKG